MNALFPHAAQTGDVIVRVSVSFLPEQSELERERWFWAYHIRIENRGDAPIQLLTRHWYITDGNGRQQEVEGEGVVGEQPMIQPGNAFDYVSGCPLSTASGSMQGSYTMVRDDGTQFEAEIPRFPLTGPAVAG